MSTASNWCTHKYEQEMRTGKLNVLLKSTMPKFINPYVMLCSTTSEENLSSLFWHTFWLFLLLFDIIRHLYRLSIGMELSWNVLDQLWLLFCCSGQADACWSICHYAKFSCSVPLLFPSKKKSDAFRSEAIHVAILVTLHFFFLSFFFLAEYRATWQSNAYRVGICC